MFIFCSLENNTSSARMGIIRLYPINAAAAFGYKLYLPQKTHLKTQKGAGFTCSFLHVAPKKLSKWKKERSILLLRPFFYDFSSFLSSCRYWSTKRSASDKSFLNGSSQSLEAPTYARLALIKNCNPACRRLYPGDFSRSSDSAFWYRIYNIAYQPSSKSCS